MNKIIDNPIFYILFILSLCFVCMVLFLLKLVQANWVPEKNLNLQNLGTVWMHQIDCENASRGECVLIPDGFDARYFKANYKKKIGIESCSGKKDCLAKGNAPCPNPSYFRVVAKNYQSTYCTKLASIKLNKDLEVATLNKEKQQETQRQNNIKSCTTSLAGNTELTNEDIKNCFKVLFSR